MNESQYRSLNRYDYLGFFIAISFIVYLWLNLFVPAIAAFDDQYGFRVQLFFIIAIYSYLFFRWRYDPSFREKAKSNTPMIVLLMGIGVIAGMVVLGVYYFRMISYNPN